jgi:NarL family two-component system response regulator LiaR
LPINVLLADNRAVMRKAIKFLLSDNDEIRIVGEASNFLETIEKTMDLSPDVIVLDLNMPDRSSFTATELKAALHGSNVVAISFRVDEEAEALAEGVGAVTLLHKMVLSRELVLTISQLGSRNWESISAT